MPTFVAPIKCVDILPLLPAGFTGSVFSPLLDTWILKGLPGLATRCQSISLALSSIMAADRVRGIVWSPRVTVIGIVFFDFVSQNSTSWNQPSLLNFKNRLTFGSSLPITTFGTLDFTPYSGLSSYLNLTLDVAITRLSNDHGCRGLIYKPCQYLG